MPDIVTVTFKVDRFVQGESTTQNYAVAVKPGMTIIEGLLQIQKEQDSTLSWRYSCRMGICGSCGMMINGTPGLACNTQILKVSQNNIHLSPLANFPVVKDLYVDTGSMQRKHRDLKPFIVEDASVDAPSVDHEYRQSPESVMTFLQFADCIKCGACMAACPTVAMDEKFPGPMPLTAMHRYNADTRDAGFQDRKDALENYHDASHCHYAAECSSVCPKGVDPARAIQLLKRSLVADSLRLRQKREPAALTMRAPPSSQEGIPSAPAFSAQKGPDKQKN